MIFHTILDTLTPAVFSPIYRRLKNDQSHRYVDEIEAFNRQSPATIHDKQDERLQAVVRVALEHSPFYAERLQSAGVNSEKKVTFAGITGLPILEKHHLRRFADTIRNQVYSPGDLRRSATGGTTASPVPIFMDWDAYWRRRGATIVFDRWFGYDPGLRIAYLWGAEQDFAGPGGVKASLLRSLVGRNRFYPSSVLDDVVMEKFYRDLRAFSPRLLQAYPAPLELFAKFLLKRNYHLSIPAISCTAEPLLPSQVETITAAFGVRPFNWYGSRECGRIATECAEHNGMHVNAHGLLLETETNEAYPNPDFGPILVTDLWNIGFPMIRYRIGDVGRLETSVCACGSSLPRVMEIVGRTTDVFENSKGQQIPGVSFTNRILTSGDEIEEMQVIQWDHREFETLIKPGPSYGSATSAMIQEKLSAFMKEPVEVRITLVEGIPPEPSGKVLFCKNNIGG